MCVKITDYISKCIMIVKFSHHTYLVQNMDNCFKEQLAPMVTVIKDLKVLQIFIICGNPSVLFWQLVCLFCLEGLLLIPSSPVKLLRIKRKRNVAHKDLAQIGHVFYMCFTDLAVIVIPLLGHCITCNNTGLV